MYRYILRIPVTKSTIDIFTCLKTQFKFSSMAAAVSDWLHIPSPARIIQLETTHAVLLPSTGRAQ